ncbi:MAG: TonB family protein [Candidatus Sulfotelmatobacter sp.]
MSTSTELWRKWEGRVVDEKFPLRQWLGGSDHSAVFLTERTGREPQKAAIKLIPAEALYREELGQQSLNGDLQLSRWAVAAKLSHPHLIRLFECGRCQIDGTRFLYVVMEYTDENLAEILPSRPLSAHEASEMLRPTAEALAYLHQAGFAHGGLKPSNIMAADNQLKISADGLGKIGERGDTCHSAYDAPEAATTGLSPAADIWSLGLTLIAVLTQNAPKSESKDPGAVAVPERLPQPFREIARRCMDVDPQRRCTVGSILRQLQAPAAQVPAPVAAKAIEAPTPRKHSKRWILVPVIAVVLLVSALVVSEFLVHQPQLPAAKTPTASIIPPGVPPTQSRAPFSERTKTPQEKRAALPGSVLQPIQPDISRSAQKTIEGRLRVKVQVSVDASGNVLQTKLVSPGPSKYFANRALAAARRWKFNPPQVDGQAAASEWMLLFQFRRASTETFPSEIRP